MNKRSLRSLLIRRLLVVVLLPWLVIVTVVLLFFMPESQRQNEQVQQILARNIMAQARDFLLQAESSMARLAVALQAEPLASGRAVLLDSYADAAGLFSTIYLLDAGGRVLSAGLPAALREPQASLEGRSMESLPLLAEVRKSGQARWSSAYSQSGDGQFAIAYLLPLDDYTLVGELSLTRSLRNLAARMEHDSPVQIFLFDQDDRLVGAPKQMNANLMEDFAHLLPVHLARQGEAARLIDFDLGGFELSGEASLLGDTDWLMLVAQPQHQARLIEHQAHLQLAVIALIAVLVTLPVAWLSARALSLRFRGFIAQMLKIAKGNYGLVLADTQIKEIDLLSEHLRLMVNAIKQRELAMVLSADGLRISQERLLATLNQTPNVAVQWFDRDGRVLMWNQAGEAMFGYSSPEALGKTADQLFFSVDQAAVFLEQLRGLRVGETIGPQELGFNRRDGSNGVMLSTSFCIPGELSEHQFACMGIDITEQKKAEQSLQEINQTLEQRVEERTAALTRSNQELIEAMQTLQHTQDELLRSEKLAALGAMVAGIAHELNTPIGNSLMAASTLQDHSKTLAAEVSAGAVRRSTLDRFIEQNQTATNILTRNLYRASELISSFKQVAVDQTSEQRRSFRLMDLVGEILLTLQPTLKKTPFKVVLDVPEPLYLESYPGPLGQILVNLINNSIAHGFEGREQGTISISARPVDSGWIELLFSDDGKGIAAENLQRIFDPFFTTRLGQGGSGLGLNITHNLVTGILGGSLSVRSEPGQGASFILRLPVVAPGA
jgi:PAS domain S-box-containing protein